MCVYESECTCVSVCWNESASECVGVYECVCVSVRVFLLIFFVPAVYYLSAHRVPIMFRNVASCFCTPGLDLGPKKEHTKPDGPQRRSQR